VRNKKNSNNLCLYVLGPLTCSIPFTCLKWFNTAYIHRAIFSDYFSKRRLSNKLIKFRMPCHRMHSIEKYPVTVLVVCFDLCIRLCRKITLKFFITYTRISRKMCSCPKNNKELCPLPNKCITESVVHLYIKPQSLLRTKLQIYLPKHMSDLQKTRLKQDLQT
jgi:hypothetical protein